jgi:putative transposase
MHDLQSVYTNYFNHKYDLSGHLWQERFFCSPLDDLHLWNAVRYVERNPIRAGLATKAEDYRWSSAQAHCGIREDPLLDPTFPPADLVPDWSDWLARGLSPAELKEIRTTTRRGVPYATQSFTQELESLLGVTLTPAKRGRPKRAD